MVYSLHDHIFSCYILHAGGQRITVTQGSVTSAKQGCPYVFAAEIEGATALSWVDLFLNPISAPGVNGLRPYVRQLQSVHL